MRCWQSTAKMRKRNVGIQLSPKCFDGTLKIPECYKNQAG
uniref:Beta-2-glycoprotein-1 fifth domain-containing protein n=1 Tax=Anguilla anguilla TaxID=7936 RepID=A0A0E9U218_ANGAN